MRLSGLILCLALCPLIQAQAPVNPGAPSPTAKGPQQAPPAQEKGKSNENGGASDKQASPKTVTINGTVRGVSCGSAHCGTVLLIGNAARRFASSVGEDGTYEVKEVPPGNYKIRVEVIGLIGIEESITLAAGDPVRHDIVLRRASEALVVPSSDATVGWWAFAALVFYILSILLTRWFKVAKSSRNFLEAQLSMLETRLGNEAKADAETAARVADLKLQLGRIRTTYLKTQFSQYVFWSQNSENAAWKVSHEIERQLAACLSPDELVHTHLITASPNLRVIATPATIAVADAIDEQLKKEQPNHELCRRLLAEATFLLNDDRDNNFITLMEWQNKATWLILVACLLIAVLGMVAGNVVLFLAGASGGLASRLMRAIHRQSVPVDYGASWTTLFLSPIYGGLSGWFGIGLIVLLSSPNVGLLGPLFTLVKWGDPLTIATLAVAFALGFSERLFSSLVDAIDQQATKTAASTQTAAPTPAKPTIPPPNPQPANPQPANPQPANPQPANPPPANPPPANPPPANPPPANPPPANPPPATPPSERSAFEVAKDSVLKALADLSIGLVVKILRDSGEPAVDEKNVEEKLKAFEARAKRDPTLQVTFVTVVKRAGL